MMNETLDLIQKFANERHLLYRLAAHQHLTPEQQKRLSELDMRLPMLWDEHRREVASARWHIQEPAPEKQRAA